MHRSAILSSNVAKLLEVMSKGAGKTSTLDTKLLKETLEAIGWDMEETVASRALTDSRQIEAFLKPWLATAHAEVWGYSGTKEPKEFWFSSEAAAVQAMQHFPLHPNPTVPHLNVGQVHVQKVERKPFQESHDVTRWRVSTQGWWLGVPAFKFTDSKGGSGIVAMTVDDRGRISDTAITALPSFWTWAYKSGLQAAAAAALAGAEVAPRAPRPGDRSMENTGTCGACMQNVKLAGGRIMRHGWSVQGQRGRGQYGSSWHTGPCMGFGYEPWEISPKAGVDYLAFLTDKVLPRVQSNLRLWSSNPPKEIPNPDYKNKVYREMSVVPVLTLTPDVDSYALSEIEQTYYAGYLRTGRLAEQVVAAYHKRVESEILHYTTELSGLNSDIKGVTARVAAWKPKPLYGTMTAAARVASRWLKKAR